MNTPHCIIIYYSLFTGFLHFSLSVSGLLGFGFCFFSVDELKVHIVYTYVYSTPDPRKKKKYLSKIKIMQIMLPKQINKVAVLFLKPKPFNQAMNVSVLINCQR